MLLPFSLSASKYTSAVNSIVKHLNSILAITVDAIFVRILRLKTRDKFTPMGRNNGHATDYAEASDIREENCERLRDETVKSRVVSCRKFINLVARFIYNPGSYTDDTFPRCPRTINTDYSLCSEHRREAATTLPTITMPGTCLMTDAVDAVDS